MDRAISDLSQDLREEDEAPDVKNVRNQLLLSLYQFCRIGLQATPHSWAYPTGRGLARLLSVVVGARLRTTRKNLAVALPELPEAQRHELVGESFRQLAGTIFDTISASRFSPDALSERVQIDGWGNFEAARGQGRGVFVLGSHFGSFEVGARVLAHRAGPVQVVSDRLSNPFYDRELRRIRQQFGIETIPEVGAALGMYRSIMSGGIVLVALDLRTRREDAIVVDFFGQPSLTSPIPAFIALKRRVPAVPVFAYRTEDGYRMEVEPPILPSGSGRAGVAEMTEQYLAVIERRIRKDPELWMWHYRRWRPEWDDPEEVGSSLASRHGDDVPTQSGHSPKTTRLEERSRERRIDIDFDVEKKRYSSNCRS